MGRGIVIGVTVGYNFHRLCGFSSVVRARPCQGRGQELESPNPHHIAFATRLDPLGSFLYMKNRAYSVRVNIFSFTHCSACLLVALPSSKFLIANDNRVCAIIKS